MVTPRTPCGNCRLKDAPQPPELRRTQPATSTLLGDKQLVELKAVAAALGEYLRQQDQVVGQIQPELITYDQAARIASVSRRTIQSWCGRFIDKHRLGDGIARVSLKSLRAYIASTKEGGE